MKALLCARNGFEKNMAGDTVQIKITAGYLRSKGIAADITQGETPDMSPYDLVHIFGLAPIEDIYEIYAAAKEKGKRTVISPIFWDLEKYYQFTGSEDRLYLLKKFKPFRKEIVLGCDMVYVSGKAEYESLREDIGTGFPFLTVRNGVSPYFLSSDKSAGGAAEKQRERFVLCAARVCPRKNQLALAKACGSINMGLLLAGSIGNKEYLAKCLECKNVKYAGELDGKSLAELYCRAHLHALTGFVETPGLSNLEAAAQGCEIISTEYGGAKEYFGGLASYCDPYDGNSITNAVIAGLQNRHQPELCEHVRENFNWEKCLEPLAESYLKIAG